jgi:Leucine rich repeat
VTGPTGAARDAAKVRQALDNQPWRTTGALSMSGLSLRSVPDPTDVVDCLISLDLSGNRLTELPEWLVKLPGLERLAAAGNRIATLGSRLAGMFALHDLDLSENRLTSIERELADCGGLRRLDISHNRLTAIGFVDQLPDLRALSAAANQLAGLDGYRFPPRLRELNLSANVLQHLPSSFQRLRSLRRLDLSDNQLSETGPLAGLPLEELYLDNNRLRSLGEIPALPHLRRLSTLGNPLDELAIADLEDSPAVRASIELNSARDSVTPSIAPADPERQALGAPELGTDFEVELTDQADTQRLLDMYYARGQRPPLQLQMTDGPVVALDQLNRTAARAVLDASSADASASVVFVASRDLDIFDRTMNLFWEAIPRLRTVPELAGAPAQFLDEAKLSRPPRVLNVRLADDRGRVVTADQTLLAQHAYRLEIGVGTLIEDTLVINPEPVRIDDADDTADGHWLSVLAVSGDVDVAAGLHRLFLPKSGHSWVCPCDGPEHHCSPNERSPNLYLTVTTRDTVRAATLRCILYSNGNVVQSVLVSFSVSLERQRGRIEAVVDYALTDDVSNAAALPKRDCNILTNDSGGTHRIVVNNGERAFTVDLTEAAASQALSAVRGALKDITIADETSRYDRDNAKPAKDFVADLRALAQLGSQLWQVAMPNRDDRAALRQQILGKATIQITRVTPTVFPWALVYDIPYELDAERALCPLLANWDIHRALLDSYPERCPFATSHGLNVVCPYGFWGFRHVLEQPPSVREGMPRNRIRVLQPALVAAARSLSLNTLLTTAHFDDLGRCFAGRFELSRCDSRAAIRHAFADPSLPLAYFYCHGRLAQLGQTSAVAPFLEIGKGDRIGATDFAAWDEAGEWGPQHWTDTAPLVFINGCGTAALSPEDLVSFVEALAGLNAAGVIGTEIPVMQQVAGEIALRFYRLFAGQENLSVGAAMYRCRIDLLRKGNISGLVYTPFCSADLALETA